QQHIRKRRVNALQLSAQSQLRQFQLQFFPMRAFKSSGKAKLAVLSYGGNKRLAFWINKKSISLRRIRAPTLRSVYRHLPRDITALQQRRCDLGKLFVSNRDGRYHTSALGLFDNLKISCHFVSRERQRLLNLDSNHFWKLRRIDGGQAKSLGKHSGNWQAKHKIVGRLQQRHGLIQTLKLAYVPRTVSLPRAKKFPAVRGRNYKDRCRRSLDVKAPSRRLLEEHWPFCAPPSAQP